MLNLTLNVLLAPWLGVAGVAASSSITVVILILFLVARMGELRAAHQLRTIFGTLIRSAYGGNGARGGGWASGVDRNPDAPRSARSHRSLLLGFASVASWLAIGMALRQPELGRLLADIAAWRLGSSAARIGDFPERRAVPRRRHAGGAYSNRPRERRTASRASRAEGSSGASATPRLRREGAYRIAASAARAAYRRSPASAPHFAASARSRP